MREYIVNLTDNLIRKHHFDAVWRQSRSNFLYHVFMTLMTDDVNEMKPETLGKVMCDIGLEDISSSWLLKETGFVGGGCEDLLRNLVSRALASVVRDRLDGHSLQPYRNKKPKVVALLHFDGPLHSCKVEKKMKEMGYRAACEDEVYAEEVEGRCVVVLGSSRKDSKGQRLVLYIDGSGGWDTGRFFDQTWPVGVCFAAVKINR
jgi:hypothetical protein